MFYSKTCKITNFLSWLSKIFSDKKTNIFRQKSKVEKITKIAERCLKKICAFNGVEGMKAVHAFNGC